MSKVVVNKEQNEPRTIDPATKAAVDSSAVRMFQLLQKIDPATTAIVDREMELEFGPGSATITTERPGRLEIATDTATQQLLVVSERYHPGWQATIDGEPAAVLPAYGEYLACVVPAGAQARGNAFYARKLCMGHADHVGRTCRHVAPGERNVVVGPAAQDGRSDFSR